MVEAEKKVFQKAMQKHVKIVLGTDVGGFPWTKLNEALEFKYYVDYGMSLQGALEAPRFFKNNAPGCDVYIESRVPEPTLQQLSERGHEIRIRREYTQEMGRGQAILHDSRTNTNYAASDPRADGEAVPEPIVP